MDGYILLEIVFPTEKCKELREHTRHRLFELGNLSDGNRITGLKDRNGKFVAYNPSEFVKLERAEREYLVSNSSWRYHRLAFVDKLAGEFANNEEIVALCGLIFGAAAAPRFSISFGNGSTQTLHQDIAVFHIRPEGYLIGVWIALEDIYEDAGPLVYYKGSHRMGLWGPHKENYPYTNVRTLTKEMRLQYESYLREACENRYERKLLTIKAGSVLLWHSHLAHGGAPWKNKNGTRNSLVIHYLPKDFQVDCSKEITGPTLW